MEKTCKKCLTAKPLEEFHRNKLEKDGRTTSCKMCRTKQSLEWHRKNKVWVARRIKEKRRQQGKQIFKLKRRAYLAAMTPEEKEIFKKKRRAKYHYWKQFLPSTLAARKH